MNCHRTGNINRTTRRRGRLAQRDGTTLICRPAPGCRVIVATGRGCTPGWRVIVATGRGCTPGCRASVARSLGSTGTDCSTEVGSVWSVRNVLSIGQVGCRAGV